MGFGSGGSYQPSGYVPLNEATHGLVQLLLLDEKIHGSDGRSQLSSSLRIVLTADGPPDIHGWKARWHLDRWQSPESEDRLHELLSFLWLCSLAVKNKTDHVGASGWCSWLLGRDEQPRVIAAAEAWLRKGKPWTELLRLVLGSETSRTRFWRLWEGENPDPTENSGDALVLRHPGELEVLRFTWNPAVETRSAARSRLEKAGRRYLDDVEARVKQRLRKARPSVNTDHFLWLARRLVLKERPVDTALYVLRHEPTGAEISRVREGQKSAAKLIGLKLRPARPGPREV